MKYLVLLMLLMGCAKGHEEEKTKAPPPVQVESVKPKTDKQLTEACTVGYIQALIDQKLKYQKKEHAKIYDAIVAKCLEIVGE